MDAPIMDYATIQARDVARKIKRPRSSRWPAVRRRFLAKNPTCAVCGGKKDVEAHHVRPFHLHPELELDEGNLIALCEGPGRGCHLVFGHYMSYRRINPNVREDVARYRRGFNAAKRGGHGETLRSSAGAPLDRRA